MIESKEFQALYTAIMMKSPFLYSLLRACKVVEDDSVLTAATDGEMTIYVSPKFFESIDDKVKASVLLHEVLHLALLHHQRKENRDHQKWNYATDAVINNMLYLDGFQIHQQSVTLDVIKNILHMYHIQPPDNLEKMSAEEIYRLLENVPQLPSDGICHMHKKESQKQKPQKMDEKEKKVEEIKDYWNRTIQGAIVMAKQAGKEPAYIERYFKFVDVKIKWYVKLKEMIDSTGNKLLATYVRPNRRVPMLQGYKKISINNIWFVIDTSGSINEDELNTACSIVYDAAKRFNSILYTVFFDEDIEVQKFTSKEDVVRKMKPIGGGGTVIYKALEYVNKNMHSSDIVIIISDCYLSDYDNHNTLSLFNAIKRRASTSLLLTSGKIIDVGWEVIDLNS